MKSHDSATFVALIAFALLIVGAVLGQPGRLPIVGGVEWTPKTVFSLVVPLLLFLVTIRSMFNAISQRVASGQYNPNDLRALLKTREFWIAGVAMLSSVAELFGWKILQDTEQQTVLANMLAAIAASLIGSWAQRLPGAESQ
jgi:hypothetical protein